MEDTRSHHRRSNHHFIHHSSTSRSGNVHNLNISNRIRLGIRTRKSSTYLSSQTGFESNLTYINMFDIISIPADEKISIALTPVKVLVHEEEQDVTDGLVDTKCCGIHDNDKMRYPKENDTTTDSVSSDVEQNPSPRRTCLRKRKERRDSIGDGQDHTKLCKSSRYIHSSNQVRIELKFELICSLNFRFNSKSEFD